MNSAYLQKQLRNNAADLEDFYKELKSWGDKMRVKEESVNKFQLSPDDNKKRKKTANENEISNEPTANGKVIDYSAWEKFDADAECEKVDYDENEESDLTDEYDEHARNQSLKEKEKGNAFVKRQKWIEAIECYTKAIEHFALDPVFYANRALCYIKAGYMVNAETDCSMSLKLDRSYVKAYHRRAVAREALNKLYDAEYDLLKVMELDPDNKESEKVLENLRQKIELLPKPIELDSRPLSKFAVARGQQKRTTGMVETVDTSKPSSHWSSGDDVLLIKTINKPPHLQSKKPLKRVKIEEISDISCTDNNVKDEVSEKSQIVKCPSIIGEVIERKEPETVNATKIMSKETKNNNNACKTSESPELVIPKNSVQFYECWRYLKSVECKYNYLKLLKPKEIPNIFKESLDSSVFSDILQILAECFVKYNENVFDFLSYLTQVKRFSTLTMFMTSNDKNFLWKLIDYIKESEERNKDEVDSLISKYEL